MKQSYWRPAGFVVALAAFAAGIVPCVASPVAAATRTADPSVDEVLARALDAVGGAEAVAGIKTIHTVMAMSAQGVNIDLESYWSRDGGRLVKSKVPMGDTVMETTMGSDGKVSWQLLPTGYALLSKKQAQDLEEQAGGFINMLDPERLKAGMESIVNAGKETFAGKECWKLHYKRKSGKEGGSFYDVDTGMPIGFDTMEKQGETILRSRGTLGDWNEYEGVKFPTTLSIESPGQTSATTMKITSVEINKVDEKTFALPDEVKKLADAAAASGSGNGAAAATEITLEDMTPEQRKTAQEALDGMRQIPDLAQMKMMVQRMESVISMVPANEQLPIKYAIQEIKKDIAKRGG